MIEYFIIFWAVVLVIVLVLYISYLSKELAKHEDLTRRLLKENNKLIDELFKIKTQ